MPISFGLLFSLMLLYWGQAAIFSYTKLSKVTTIVLSLCIISLTSLLICRSLDSGHLPLSNLYESLLFLSWSFLAIQLFLQINSKRLNPYTAPVHTNETKADEYFNQAKSMQNLTKQLTLQNEVGAKIRYPKTEFLEATHSPKGSFLQALQSEALYGDNQGLVQLLEEPASNTNADTSNFYISSALLQDQFVHFLGVITSPMSLLIYGFASLNLPKEMQKATSLVPALQSNWLMMHVTVMILSYAALLCGSIFSMAFLFLNFLEKRNSKDQNLVPAFNKQKNRFTNENSMSSPLSLADKLDNYSYRVLALGFPLLTVGILSGAVWANQAWGSYWSWDPKESWALITWLVFAIYLHARITKGWNGEKPAIIATFGFFVIWFCYLGVNLLGTGLHSYGWFSK